MPQPNRTPAERIVELKRIRVQRHHLLTVVESLWTAEAIRNDIISIDAEIAALEEMHVHSDTHAETR
jgi:hypothetical protein